VQNEGPRIDLPNAESEANLRAIQEREKEKQKEKESKK